MPDLSTTLGVIALILVLVMTNPKTVEVIDEAIGERADRYLAAKRKQRQETRKRTYSTAGARSSRQD